VSARILLFIVALGAPLIACGPAPAPAAAETKPIPGKLTNAIGTGRQGFDGDGSPASQSWLNQPTEVAFDADDNLFVVDWNNHRLRQLQNGKLRTVIGSRLPGDWPPDVEASAAVAGTELALNHPMDVAFANDGQAYVAAWHNHKLLELEPNDGSVRRIAGGARPGYAGDGGAGDAALLNFPGSLVIDASGALLLADQRNNVIRRIAADQQHTITTVAGVKAPSGYQGDAGPAATAALGMCPYDEAGGSDNPPPGGALALDADGNLYIADTFNHCVRRILAGDDGLVGAGDSAQEIIETFAGECEHRGFDADIEPRQLLLDTPRDLEVHDGGLYITDSGNSVIWRVELDTGKATRILGTGEAGEAENDSLPLEAPLHQPYGIGFDRAGNLYIADTLSHRVLVLGSTADEK
jgi:sugar lactone lactonase YvrE